MTTQDDLFSGDETTVRSFPAHLDPARAVHVTVTPEIHRDHVAARVDGALPVGAVGNNSPVYVLRVHDRANVLLHAETFPDRAQAERAKAELRAAIQANAQGQLL